VLPSYAWCSSVWPVACAKTSSRLTPQEVTLGPEVNEPPRSSHSVHWEEVGVGDGVGDGVADIVGIATGVAAGTAGRSMTKRPTLASSKTKPPRIAANRQRRWTLIMASNTT
jgi:hypothetical protein